MGNSVILPKLRWTFQSLDFYINQEVDHPIILYHVGICARIQTVNSGHLPWSSVSNPRTVKSQVCDGRLVCWPLPTCRKKGHDRKILKNTTSISFLWAQNIH